MSAEPFVCPRQRAEAVMPSQREHVAHLREDGTCSYCGSMSEERFFAAIEAGCEIGPTDKNYKAYVDSSPAFPITQTYRDCPPDATCTGPADCTHWTTRPTSQGKFYFQHLSEDGRARFIAAHNERRINIGYPGHFYVTPFFCAPVQPEAR